jgi:hypothetical protein
MRTPVESTIYAGTASAAALPEGAPSLPSRVAWGAVIAGAVVALAVSFMLNALGAGIGATTVDAAARDTPSAATFGIGAAIWVLIANLIGLAAGGYVAARLSGTADNTDGTLHGLAVWGTTFLISAVLLGNLVAGVASTAATGASSIIGGAARGAGTAVAAAANTPGAGDALQNATQGVLDRVQGTLSGGGGAPGLMTSDQRKAEMAALAARRVAEGRFTPAERERLNALVAAEYNISLTEAQQRVDEAEQQAAQAAQQAEATVRRAADAAASGAATTGFSIFGIMLLGAFASVFGARRGTRDLLVVGTSGRGVRR